ncbi:unnamed protein product [Diatraea saccharalis]|uniref:Uncharacterized protein n=1 Tax=Diatraea saccharalis TaxID=40085 RepID=A0A9N9WES6_9NEOP|nr:unnamed protein product [Diatraea saccharalis]
MRKTSQDGGDATSITSSIENEIKKSAAGIVKMKRNSIKRKVQNFSNESDDGVGEPLLQKEKVETLSQSAKFLLSKTKTDIKNEKLNDKQKSGDNMIASTKAMFYSVTESSTSGAKDNSTCFNSRNVVETSTVHNHMNTNVFNNSDGAKNDSIPKSHILVEIDSNKSSAYNPGPLIFTTAKIHTDGTNKHMEPLQVTPVPILSTVEGSIIKTSPVRDVEDKLVKNYNILSSDIQKSDTALTTILGNNFKGVQIPVDNNTIAPILHEVSTNRIQENDVMNPPVLNKTSAIDKSKLPIKKSENKLDDAKSSILTGATVSKEIKAAPAEKQISTSDGTSSSTSLKMDMNKNFETSSKCSDIKKVPETDCYTSVSKDKSAKVSSSFGNKQLQRQTTLRDTEELVKTTSSMNSQSTKMPNVIVKTNVNTAKEKSTLNLTSQPIFTVTTTSISTPITSVTKLTSASSSPSTNKTEYVLPCVPKHIPITTVTTLNTTPASNTKLKNSIAAPSNTVSIMSTEVKLANKLEHKKSTASNGKLNNTSSIKSGVAKISNAQGGRNSTIPITSSKPFDVSIGTTKKILESHPKDVAKARVSTNSTLSDKSAAKVKRTEAVTADIESSMLTKKSKEIPSVTSSNKSYSTDSKPIATETCPSTVTKEYSAITIVPSTGSTSKVHKVLTPCNISGVDTTKPTTSCSTKSSIKIPESTKGTVAASVSTQAKSNNLKSDSTNITPKTTELSSSTKTSNTSVCSITSVTGAKSPTTTPLPAPPKPSVTHNQNQLERSESKKEKLK